MRRLLFATIAIAVLLVLGGVTSSVAKSKWSFGWGNSHGVRGSGVATTVDRKVDGFDRIEISLGADLDITVGPEFRVTMTCDDNLVDLITTRVRGRTLEIDSRGSFSTRENIKLEITLPKLTGLSVDGSGRMTINKLSGDDFTLDISGSADVTCDGSVADLRITIDGSGDAEFTGLTAERVEVELYGSGDIALAGTCKEMSVAIPGSGYVDARDLKCQDVIADISGSGNVDVWAENSLDGSVSGSGDIRYWGTPSDVNRNVSGHGRITRKS
jgi:hypothetical protein